MQTDSLKSRLSTLKKASIQLKSKVINQPKINYDSINQIISNILPSKDGQYHFNFNNQQNSTIDMAMTVSKVLSSSGKDKDKLSNTIAMSPTNSFLAPSSPNNNSAPAQTAASPAKPQTDKSYWRQRSSSNDSGLSRDPLDNQIQKLKQQNQEIQLQLNSIAQQMRQIHKKQIMQQQQSWKQNLPFMDISDQAGIFITKLFIKQYDYDKIDYQQGKICLNSDKMLVNLSMKPQRQFKLTSLGQVKYIGQNVIKIDFKNQETVFMFVQFQNVKKRENWDLALYVNHTIISSKDLDRSLFVQTREKEDSFTPQFSKTSKNSQQRSDTDQKFLQYKSADKLDKIRKSSSKMSQRWKIKGSNVSSQSQKSSLKRQDSFRNFNGIQYTLNGNSFDNNNIEEFPTSPAGFVQQNIDNKSFHDIVVFGNGLAQSHHEPRTNTSRFNVQEINFQNVQAEVQAEYLGPSIISPQKIQEQRDLLKWQTTIKNLKQGYFFTKYAKDGSKPHNKKVFLSNNEQTLISMSTTDPSDRKVINIQNIKHIRYPSIDAGIKKFATEEVSQNYCVLLYQLDGAYKLMELGCHNAKFTSRFIEELREFLNKKGLSYLND